jgi:hypothetical protein
MKNTIIILSLLIISSCSSRATGKYEFPIYIETFDSNKKEIISQCKIIYTANCGPINISCKKGNLSGLYGLLPKPEDDVKLNTLLSSGAGILFDRIVDSTTPFGMFVRYTNAFDNSTCLIPKKISIVLE